MPAHSATPAPSENRIVQRGCQRVCAWSASAGFVGVHLVRRTGLGQKTRYRAPGIAFRLFCMTALPCAGACSARHLADFLISRCVLYACVKVMLPLACLLLLGATLWQLFVPEVSGIPWADNTNPWIPPRHETFAWLVQVLSRYRHCWVQRVVGWVAYAFASGRGIKQRLTDPAPIVTEADALVNA